MNMESRTWTWAVAILSMLTATGCSADTAVKKMTETQPAVAEAPKQEIASVIKEDGKLQPVFFETGKSLLTSENVETLKKNVEWLQQNPPYLIQITGFSDKRGSTMKNQRLAERRALNVRDTYQNLGIAKSRILVKAKEEEPECKDLTEECFAQSRRVETFVEMKPLAKR